MTNAAPLTASQADLALVAQTCACLSVRKAARAVTQFYDNALTPSGIGIAQAGLLIAIQLRGAQPRHELAKILVMDRTTLARNLKLLERDGLIESVSGEDRRTRAVALTDAGRVALARALPYWQEAQRQVVDLFGEDTWVSTRSQLKALEELYQP
jgi:DNA-binding MarR family transcriptional regulator